MTISGGFGINPRKNLGSIGGFAGATCEANCSLQIADPALKTAPTEAAPNTP